MPIQHAIWQVGAQPTLLASSKLVSETTLAGVPPEGWAYTLGNRCAIDWVLGHYKEKVIDLLARVTTVSVETVRIVAAMKGAVR